jgi:hypothetical protein
MSLTYFDDIKQRIVTTDRVEMAKRLLVLWQVCMYGLAYEQVELPGMLYVVPTYLSVAVFYYLCCLRPIAFLQHQIIPLTYLLVRFIWAIFHGDDVTPDILTVLTVSNLLLLNRESKMWVYTKLRLFLVAMCAAGALCYISYCLKLGLPYVLQDYYFGNAHYVNFHVAYINSSHEELFPRLCGLFNEPGYLGTIVALALIVDRMNLRRPGNAIMFLAGIFTFSFAFWVLILLYMVVRNISKPARIIAVICVVFAGLIYVQNTKFENKSVQFLVERFSTQNGKLKGDNRRTNLYDMLFDKMVRSDQYMFGRGPNSLQHAGNIMTLSYSTYIYQYGIVGFAILWLVPMVLAVKYSRRNLQCCIFIMLFFISTYQRPHFYSPLYLTLLFGGIDYIFATQKFLREQTDEADDEEDLDAIKVN